MKPHPPVTALWRAARLAAAAWAFTLAGCVKLPPSLFGGSRGPVEAQVVIPAESPWTRAQILILDLTGIVSVESSSGVLEKQTGMLVRLKDRLMEAKDNRNLRAVILRIDSPGGGVTASDLIHHEIKSFKAKWEEEHDRALPVVAIMQDVAASGGLYIAMAADEIYAMPTTITGSIGVISMLPGLKGLSEKVGFEMRVIKSGPNKDLGSPWRDLGPEEALIFQSMIDSMYARFLDVILASRESKGLTREELLKFADGRVLHGSQAAELKLIDGIKYPEEVIERAKQLAGVEDADVITYEYPWAWRGNFYADSPAPSRPLLMGGGDVNLLKLDAGLEGLAPRDARFMYMWLP